MILNEKCGKRLDQSLMEILQISRSKCQKMIENESILVNGKKVRSSYLIKENDEIEVLDYIEPVMDVTPEKMDLDIIYEDNDVLIVNKANGIVVHPGSGNYDHTLVNGLLYHSSSLSNTNGDFRPGIVHRIDAYTTGLLMVAKNNEAHEILAKQLEQKTTTRKYIALVWGIINNDTGTIDAPIGRDKKDRKKMAVVEDGKKAVTHFRVLERFKEVTLIELSLETGRTHQIRVHMNYIDHPVVNDPVYGKRKKIDETGQCLHAKTLGFHHPKTGQYMEFTSELPNEFLNILDQFKDS